MDLLSQYKQDHPEAFQEQKRPPLTDEYGRTYTGMIALVMRLSGGRIRDARTASYALLGLVGIITLVTIIVFWTTVATPESSKIYSPIAEPPRENDSFPLP